MTTDQTGVFDLADRFRGALLGAAIGDALGSHLGDETRRRRSSLFDWVDTPPAPLTFTSDTRLTLAVARSLIHHGGFCEAHMTDALATAESSSKPSQSPIPNNDEATRRQLATGRSAYGNAAAMRVAPIGLFYHREPMQAAERGRAAARITHAHPIGQDGAGMQAAAVAELLGLPPGPELDPSVLFERLRDHAATRRFRDLLDSAASLEAAPESTVVRVLGNGIEAHRSVPTALHAFLRHRDSFAEAILFALSLGGETDTIASMTGALAGASLGAEAIVDSWSSRLEEREEVVAVAGGLLERALDSA